MSTDNLTPAQRKRTMAAVHSEDTGPEMRVRRLIHSMGYRYRLHKRDLPGNPDLVFPRWRKAIFVHGCFWHGHDCKAGSKRPKSNQAYWTRKLERNKARDAINQTLLQEAGWKVMIIWECQIKDITALEQAIRSFLAVEQPVAKTRKNDLEAMTDE